ncbi:MAG: hypothetical protein M5U09_26600 [Gammaproteobacteria bacterium]|nr:hypothetical protein [Gammaproteobacteria bacterium]
MRNQLRRAGFKVSVHTVRRVLDDNGYVAPKVRREEGHDRRYEAVRPNALWHMDFLQRYVHKQQVSVLLVSTTSRATSSAPRCGRRPLPGGAGDLRGSGRPSRQA